MAYIKNKRPGQFKDRRPGGGQFIKRKKRICIFCADKKVIDYKNISLLRRFVSDRGKILSQRSSGCCSLHQRRVAKAVKHTRQLGLLPYLVD